MVFFILRRVVGRSRLYRSIRISSTKGDWRFVLGVMRILADSFKPRKCVCCSRDQHKRVRVYIDRFNFWSNSACVQPFFLDFTDYSRGGYMVYVRTGYAADILQTHPLIISSVYTQTLYYHSYDNMTASTPYLSDVPPTYMGNLMKMIPLFREFNGQKPTHIHVPTIFYVPLGDYSPNRTIPALSCSSPQLTFVNNGFYQRYIHPLCAPCTW